MGADGVAPGIGTGAMLWVLQLPGGVSDSRAEGWGVCASLSSN